MTLPVDFYTPNRIIRFAMQDAGLLQKGSDPNGEDLADYMNRLNELIITASTQGLKLWLQFLQPITLVAGQALYTLGPSGNVPIQKPSRIIQGYYLDSSGTQRPLIPLSWDDWNRLSNKTQQGEINSYFVDKQAYVTNLWFWLMPNAEAAMGTAQMLIQQQQANPVALTDTMQLPPEWGMWLHWGLADQICTGAPQAIMDRCEKKAAAAFDALSNWDVEDAPTFFQPDIRMASQFGRPR